MLTEEAKEAAREEWRVRAKAHHDADLAKQEAKKVARE